MNHILKYAALDYEDIEVERINEFVSIFVDGRKYHDNEIMVSVSHIDEFIEALQKAKSDV
jgi:hypothetical protein